VPDDTLVLLIESAPVSPDPRFALGAYDFKLARLLYAPLVSVDNPRVEPQLELAESVTPVDDTHWEIVLREARFSDGTPVEAADVVWTVETMRDPRTGSRMRQRFLDAGLTTIEADGPRKVRVALSHPHAPFLTDLDFGVLKRPPPGAPPSDRGTLPVGAGPFVYARRDSQSWYLDANPHYFRGRPPLAHLVVKTIRDDNSRLLALVGGSGDLTQNTVSPLVLDAVAENPRLRVATGRSSVYSYLGLNCADPILADVRVRRAIAHAIDKERLIASKLKGRALAATGLLPTFHWAYSGEVPRYAFDPAEARRLLDEAGHPDPDGDGPLPRFTLVYRTSNNRFRVAIAGLIARMLEDVGIAVDLRINDFSTFFADVKKGNFQIFTMDIPEIAEPHLYINFFASSHIPTRDNLDAGANRMRYRSADVDRLLAEGARTLDRARRVALYAEVQRHLATDLPVISLWHADNVAVLRKEVTGYEILPTAQWSSVARTRKAP
jgi:peptide/nickel transport system substrate-binding protein